MKTSRQRRLGCRALGLAMLAGLVWLSPSLAKGDERGPGECPSGSLRVISQRHYTVAVRVRPLLFWIERKNVGDGRLTWSESAAGSVRVEFLIGSDPNRTPRRINRWGYIAETTCGSTSTLVGVMTQSDEQSVEEATARLRNSSHDGQAFSAIRAVVTHGESRAWVTPVRVDEDYTYRELEEVLRRVPDGGAANRRIAVEAGAAQGFLATAAALVRESLTACHPPGRTAGVTPSARAYVHGDRLYDMRLRSCTPLAAEGPDTPEPSLVEADFEVRTRATGRTTRFRLTYPTGGPLAGVPVRIVYRPRWWFEAEMTLAGDTTSSIPHRCR